MKQIERYIQFAIDNGYKEKYFHLKNTEITYIWIFNCAVITLEEKSQMLNGNCIELSNPVLQESKIYPLNEVIQSKPFIEAIARGVRKKLTIVDKLDKNYKEINIEKFNNQTKYIYLEYKKWINWFNDIYPKDEEKILYRIIREITIQQSEAIRENKLQELIYNLLPEEN